MIPEVGSEIISGWLRSHMYSTVGHVHVLHNYLHMRSEDILEC